MPVTRRPKLPIPLRSEAEAFQTLVYFVVFAAVVVGVVLVVRAVS